MFDRSNALVFDGVISGAGAVVQQGAGTTTLTAASNYTGADQRRRRTAAGRRLDRRDRRAWRAARGSAAPAPSRGTVTIADGGHLAPGTSVGTLTVGALVLDRRLAARLRVLGLPDIVGGDVNDLTVVNGALTLDGSLNLADAGGLSRGVYRIINYGGALTDNGLVLGGLPTRFLTNQMLISTATAGEVNLIVSPTSSFGLQFWDGANTLGNGAVDGGSATWNTATTNWTAVDGSVNAPWQGGFAVFQGTAGTVTLGAPIAFEGHAVPHHRLCDRAPAGFGLAAAPDTIIRVDPTVTATINAPITEAGGAARSPRPAPARSSSAAPTATAAAPASTAAPSRSAPTPVSARPAGALGLNAGTLATTASFASARAVTLGENGGTFSTGAGTQLTLGGAIAGAGHARQDRRGHAHPHRRQQLCRRHLHRRRRARRRRATPTSAPRRPARPRRRHPAPRRQLRPRRHPRRTLGALGGTIDTGGNTSTFAQGITGTGALTKTGAGTLTLTGANTYAGGTTIGAGTLQIGNGGTTGSLVGNIVNNGSLVIDRSNAATLRRHDQRQRLARPGRHRHDHPYRRQQLYRRHHHQRRHAADRRWRHHRQHRRRCRQQRHARLQPLGRDRIRRHDQRHRRGAPGGHRHAHADRRQHLHRRHHDRRRHPADRRRRDQRQRRRQCRQQWRARVQPLGRGHLCRRDQRHRHARPDRAPAS